jgi:hypothetical protein
MKTLIKTFLLSIALFATSLAAQGPSTGQFDLSGLSGDLSPKVNINFGPAMMSGFAESMSGSNPDLSSILGGVAGLRLMVFEDVATAGLEAGISDAIAELLDAGWSQAVQIRDDDTLIDLFLAETPDYVKGMVLLLRDDGDTLILANVHGDLDPTAVGRLVSSGNAFNGWNFDFSDGEMSIEQDG